MVQLLGNQRKSLNLVLRYCWYILSEIFYLLNIFQLEDVQKGKGNYITKSVNIKDKNAAENHKSSSTNLAKRGLITDKTSKVMPTEKPDKYIKSPTKVDNGKSISMDLFVKLF